ncbi:MAG: beta-propeller fold lactonase family protein [Micrococcus sp.]|nr:beta-propeller fold lactonase family protein [Micrococcus sp.]
MTASVLVGTFNEPGEHAPALPSSGGIVRTAGWPEEPRTVAGSGPDAPSWLVPGRPGAPSGGRLYAAQHVSEGALAVLSAAGPEVGAGAGPGSAADDVGWVITQQVPTGGENTCHADLNPAGTWLAAASYDSGTLTIAKVLDDGRLGRPVAVQAPEGSGPVQSRQDAPHLHFVLFLDDDRLLVTDLGGDRILEYSVAALEASARATEGGPTGEAPGAADGQACREVGGEDLGDPAGGMPADGAVAGIVRVSVEPVAAHHLPGGTGPRHLAVLPARPEAERPGPHLAVVGELDSRLHVLGLDAGPEGFPEVGIVPTHAQDADPEAARDNLPSHLVVSADGALVYVANRGRDTIGVIRRGEPLELIAEVPCGGNWPRHIALAGPAGGQGLLVALERDDAVVYLPLDAAGIPQAPTGRAPVRRPGFLLPVD